MERQAGRVAALENKAQRRADQADQAWEADRRAHDALPEGGEPIHVGHHSQRRHRRAIETAHRTLGQAVAAEEDAKAARRRAESAAVTTSARYNPETVKNRIDSLQASQRADQRLLDGHERTLFVVRGVKQVEKTAPVEGCLPGIGYCSDGGTRRSDLVLGGDSRGADLIGASNELRARRHREG
ncbi:MULTISPECIES: DUF3560 domain-containing protein [Rhodococcus]|uniref:DUF3560 domain-containing protein n=1 Tax=Rhodococcus TaxID=1827 RepID=UPI0029538331|nr:MULTISPECIES: DUF3560 domain-containing protein [Rhodococcus]MDV7246301.1 DUF3560 domain-containing protein [Rhodococcus oxybenzonivorans]MDV8030833.1 DUF3560 domain-containing protein [Rhodococcus sp. IEGM 27]